MKIENVFNKIISDLEHNIFNERYSNKNTEEQANAFLNEDFMLQTEVIRCIIIDNQLVEQEFLPYLNYNNIAREVIDRF